MKRISRPTSVPLQTSGLLAVAGVLLLLLLPGSARAGHYEVEVSKSAQELLVREGEQIIRRYRVASGMGGSGTKQQMGDKKTPVGVYQVIELRDNSRFQFFMHLNYPNAIDAWNGYQKQLIGAREFRDIVAAVREGALPPQDTPLGGYIGLHGIGEVTEEKLDIHARHDWTEGCIALTNEEILELRNYIDVGTRVVIRD